MVSSAIRSGMESCGAEFITTSGGGVCSVIAGVGASAGSAKVGGEKCRMLPSMAIEMVTRASAPLVSIVTCTSAGAMAAIPGEQHKLRPCQRWAPPAWLAPPLALAVPLHARPTRLCLCVSPCVWFWSVCVTVKECLSWCAR